MQEVNEAERNALIFKANLDVPIMNSNTLKKKFSRLAKAAMVENFGESRPSKVATAQLDDVLEMCTRREFSFGKEMKRAKKKGGEEEDLNMLPVRL